METMQVFHMNKGEGETSYANNSSVQKKIISAASSIIEEALVSLVCENYTESMGIVDLGCSSGPNTLSVIMEILNIVEATSFWLGRPMPEFRVSLNDLPGNDFNHIFTSLPAFYNRLRQGKGDLFDRCYISGTPGSFYGRLFPSKSLHFVHSSSSLHWLSQVPHGLDSKAAMPMNKGKIYISETSPAAVWDAYATQFRKDFSLFLKSRSEEMVAGGRMVLSFLGRGTVNPTTEESCYQWELLARALMSMVAQGLVEEEKIDRFNAPYYAPYSEEVEQVVEKEGSFVMDRMEGFEIDWDGGFDIHQQEQLPEAGVMQQQQQQQQRIINNTNNNGKISSGEKVAKTVRAVVESMVESHFGKEVMDELFRRYGEMVDDHFSKSRPFYINLVCSFTKKY